MTNLFESLTLEVDLALALLEELALGLDVPDLVLPFFNLLLQPLDVLHLQLVPVQNLLLVLLVYFVLLLQQQVLLLYLPLQLGLVHCQRLQFLYLCCLRHSKVYIFAVASYLALQLLLLLPVPVQFR